MSATKRPLTLSDLPPRAVAEFQTLVKSSMSESAEVMDAQRYMHRTIEVAKKDGIVGTVMLRLCSEMVENMVVKDQSLFARLSLFHREQLKEKSVKGKEAPEKPVEATPPSPPPETPTEVATVPDEAVTAPVEDVEEPVGFHAEPIDHKTLDMIHGWQKTEIPEGVKKPEDIWHYNCAARRLMQLLMEEVRPKDEIRKLAKQDKVSDTVFNKWMTTWSDPSKSKEYGWRLETLDEGIILIPMDTTAP